MKNIIISDFREIDLIGFWNPAEEIPMIAIYVHPKDYPDKYVARLWATGKFGPRASLYIVIADSLEDIRKAVPPGMFRWPRDVKDDPVLVETWI